MKLFDYRKPSINNRLSYFSRFLELKLFEYINEFELATQVYGEKSVNIDTQRCIVRLISISIILFIIDKIKRIINYNLLRYNDTS